MNWDLVSQTVTTLIEKGGPLGTLVLCVGMFLMYLWRKSDEDVKAEEQRNASMERMGNACHTQQLETLDRVERMHERTAQALDRNTEAFGRTAAALDKVLKTRNRKPREPKFVPEPDEQEPEPP